MGNKLVEAVKTVIRPIDYYLRQIESSEDFHYKCSLGQTQFLKVAHCRHHDEGDVVIKVLPRKDRSLLLEPYCEQLLKLSKLVDHNVSITSFRIVEIRMDFVYAIRQYFRYSLYDRLSTRPFLTDLEKYWIIFQLLKTLNWLHSRNIQHGDLKLENIMITSNLWMILTDFAPFKPVNLPEDDPSIFNYYFDISRRRCCNLAPERFLPSIDDYGFDLNLNNTKLTNQMDMFSFGCIMAEIFSENFLFDLGDLLKFKHQQNYRDKIIDKIDSQIKNEATRSIIKNLINIEPNLRKSSQEILTEMRQQKLFPNYFDEFYILMINLIHLKPDPKILYLSRHLDHYLELMITEEDSIGTLILLMIITTSMRSLQHVHCKLEAQRLILHMVKKNSSKLSPFIIDRLVPYLMVCLTEDQNHLVRAQTIDTLADLLEQVNQVPPNDSNIFLDYILEKLEQCLSREKSILVRTRIAINLNRFIQAARKFLLQSCDLNNLNLEMNLLQKDFQTLISTILTDPDTKVRRSLFLMPESCAIICAFLGPTKTIETMLSHLVTFLNEKKDFQLRLLFFETVPMVGTFLGNRHGQYSQMLYPFIQQGLYDVEEFCIEKTISSITDIIEQGLLNKQIVFNLFREIIPFVYHPNPWIRGSTVCFLKKIKEKLSPLDLNYKIADMGTDIIGFNPILSMHRLLTCEPLNRKFYDVFFLMKNTPFLSEFFEIISVKRFQTDNLILKSLNDRNFDFNNENNLKKLKALGDLIQKIQQNKQRHRNLRTFMTHDWSIIIYQERDQNLRSRSKQLPISSIITKNHKIVSELSEPIQCPPHLATVNDLIKHKQQQSNSFFYEHRNDKQMFVPDYVNDDFKIKGQLITQLYEHKLGINSIVRCERIFITCSDDGSVRVWDHLKNDCNNHNENFKNNTFHGLRPSIACYQHQYALHGMIICSKYLICWSTDDYDPRQYRQLNSIIKYQNSTIIIFELTSMVPLCFLCHFQINGLITSICKLNEHLFAVSTSDSKILIYDCRQLSSSIFFNVPVIKLNVPVDRNFIKSMDGSSNGLVLFASTLCGYLTGFDLRFQMSVIDWQHLGEINKIRYCDRGLFTSTVDKSNGQQQLILWDYKVAEKSLVLTSSLPKFIKDQDSKLETLTTFNAILPIQQKQSMIVITGGCDSRIRYWNLDQTELSYMISGLDLEEYSNAAMTSSSSPIRKSLSCIYRERSEGAIRFIDEEIRIKKNFNYDHYQPPEDALKQQQQTISSNHQDSIADLVNIDQYLISGGRNGVIKIWK